MCISCFWWILWPPCAPTYLHALHSLPLLALQPRVARVLEKAQSRRFFNLVSAPLQSHYITDGPTEKSEGVLVPAHVHPPPHTRANVVVVSLGSWLSGVGGAYMALWWGRGIHGSGGAGHTCLFDVGRAFIALWWRWGIHGSLVGAGHTVALVQCTAPVCPPLQILYSVLKPELQGSMLAIACASGARTVSLWFYCKLGRLGACIMCNTVLVYIYL